MKQVTMESISQRIADLERARFGGLAISLQEERELACLHQLVAVTEQRDALVAEMSIVKNDYATIPEVKCIGWPNTPNFDAARAALRAEGVEMLLTENFKAEIAAALADFDCVDDVTLQTVIWSGQPPEPDGDVWHIEYMTRGYQVQKKIRDFARQLRESKGANHE